MELNFEPFALEAGSFDIDELSSDDMAVVGIAFQLPGANTLESLWAQLTGSDDAIRPLPHRRSLDIQRYMQEAGLSTGAFAKGGYLDDIDKFDHAYFRLSPKEAALMDPHQRLFLETAWSAIEDAGYGGDALAGQRVGVYVGHSGFSPFSYLRMVTDLHPQELPLSFAGNLPGVIASRIAYLLDLKGPSMLIDTTCSSSLVALHTACQAIRSGECDAALVGSAKLTLIPQDMSMRVGVESSDGRTRTFDAASDGTGNGEGVIAVLIKPLSQAVIDRDSIYAVIKGSAVNQDGSSIGLTAPNAAAQEDAIARAWHHAGVNPESITYIEAHGTGTKLGDPIEIDGIKRAFARHTKRRQFCAIGSIKSNIGHLDHAAGLAGLLKVITALQYKQLPPSMHFQRPNREIAFEQSPVYVLDEAREWTTESGVPRRGGISAFGLSGTNCHVVVEEAPAAGTSEGSAGPYVLTLSAKTAEALRGLVQQYAEALETGAARELEAGAICATASMGRGHYSHRLAVVGEDREALLQRLRELTVQLAGSWTGIDVWYGESGGIDEAEAELKDACGACIAKARELDDAVRADGIRRLAELYAQGASVDWAALYLGHRYRKASLPTYPFARTRCWIDLPEAADAGMRMDRAHLYHAAGWTEEPIAAQTIQNGTGAVLLVRGADDRSRELADLLRKHGRHVVEAVESAALVGSAGADDAANAAADGAGMLLSAGGMVEIPTDEAGYRRLFEELADSGIVLSDIIHMRTAAEAVENNAPAEDRTIDGLEAELERGVYDLFRLLKTVRSDKGGITLTVMTSEAAAASGTESAIRPSYAAMLGLLRSAALDQPRLRCKAVDVDHLTTAAALAAELGAAGHGRFAYREGTRYAEVLTRLDAAAVQPQKPELSSAGAYLITGGTGRIGLELGAELAAIAGERGVQLVLAQRGEFPAREQWAAELARDGQSLHARRIRQIMAIEQAGSRVSIVRADVSEPEQAYKVLADIRQQYGALKGIIHSAGVGVGERGLPIGEETQEGLARMLAPKVQGTWLLDRLTEQDELEFFVVCSSAITIAGGAGAASYTAANAYLDGFAQERSRRGKRTLALNWPAWDWEADPGEAYREGYESRQLFRVIEAQTARHVFTASLERGMEQVIVGAINWKSSLHGLKELLPFRLSASLEAELASGEGASREQAGAEASAPAGSRKAVGLRGRSAAEGYSGAELLVGQIWGEALGFDELDIASNFYALGGDSIFAMQMVNRIKREAGVELTAADVLSRPTIAELGGWIERQQATATASGLAAEPAQAVIPVAQPQESYPLSSAQKRMYFLDRFDRVQAGYNMPALLITENVLDSQRVELVFGQLIERHEALRTTFEMEEGEPEQRITPMADVSAAVNRIGFVAESELEACMARFVRPFDLSRDLLIRIGVGETDGGRGLLFVDLHHITSDGMTMAVIMQEFMTLYLGGELAPQRIQYKDFAVWQGEQKNVEALRRQAGYWLDTFAELAPVMEMPTDFRRPAIKSYEGEHIYFDSTAELSASVYKGAGEQGVTLYMYLLAAYQVLLHQYTGQEDMVIGSPMSSRLDADVERMVGMFVNTMAMRGKPARGKTFAEFVQEVRRTTLQVHENRDYPFEDLVSELDVRRDTSRSPLFDYLFTLHNTVKEQVDLGRLGGTLYPFVNRIAKFDLTLNVYEDGGLLRFSMEYSTKLFKRETIEKLAARWVRVLEELSRDANQRIGEVSVLAREEEEALLAIGEGSGADKETIAKRWTAEWTEQATLDGWFAGQAARMPERTAVVADGERLTYGELNATSEKLAHVLRAQGVGPDVTVGLIAGRKTALIVGLLGILKAGGAYVPIEPSYPLERKLFMAQDSGSRLIVSCGASSDAGQLGLPMLDLSNPESWLPAEAAAALEAAVAERPEAAADTPNGDETAALTQADSNTGSPNRLAYVIYTSGTTGQPKGVMIEHRSVVRLVQSLWERVYRGLPAAAPQSVALVAPYVFDASVQQIFAALLLGHELHLVPEETRRDGAQLAAYYERHGITVSDGTPVHARMLAEAGQPLRVKRFLIGGDVLTTAVARALLAQCGEDAKAFNVYGPTECCVDSTCWQVELSRLEGREEAPIGEPLGNRIRILDRYGRLALPGTAGEVYIGGAGVARGYLNRPELTVERFVADPYAKGERLYRTGDLGRWLPEGGLEYLGRMDEQVKVRGYRIELGEIESRLLDYEDVIEAAVTVRENADGEKELCAYVRTSRPISVSQLRTHLSHHLPEYMLPTHYTELERMPMTVNGKLDRAALPEPQHNVESGLDYTAPQNEVERIMADIWSELLGHERVGIHDNFFDVGGNSLLLIRMFSRLEKQFPGQLSVSDLFSYTTIEQLSALLGAGSEEKAVSIGLVALPDRFVVRGGGAAGVFRFALPVDTSRRMTAIADRAGVEPAAVLIALFGLLLNEYSGSERICLHAMVTERLKVSALELDFSDMTELNALIGQTQDGLMRKDSVGSLLTAPSSRPSYRDAAPLFYAMDLYEQSASLTAVYDIALGLHRDADSGALAFLFEYSSAMNAQQMRQAAQNYLELAELLVENEQSSVR